MITGSGPIGASNIGGGSNTVFGDKELSGIKVANPTNIKTLGYKKYVVDVQLVSENIDFIIEPIAPEIEADTGSVKGRGRRIVNVDATIVAEGASASIEVDIIRHLDGINTPLSSEITTLGYKVFKAEGSLESRMASADSSPRAPPLSATNVILEEFIQRGTNSTKTNIISDTTKLYGRLLARTSIDVYAEAGAADINFSANITRYIIADITNDTTPTLNPVADHHIERIIWSGGDLIAIPGIIDAPVTSDALTSNTTITTGDAYHVFLSQNDNLTPKITDTLTGKLNISRTIFDDISPTSISFSCDAKRSIMVSANILSDDAGSSSIPSFNALQQDNAVINGFGKRGSVETSETINAAQYINIDLSLKVTRIMMGDIICDVNDVPHTNGTMARSSNINGIIDVQTGALLSYPECNDVVANAAMLNGDVVRVSVIVDSIVDKEINSVTNGLLSHGYIIDDDISAPNEHDYITAIGVRTAYITGQPMTGPSTVNTIIDSNKLSSNVATIDGLMLRGSVANNVEIMADTTDIILITLVNIYAVLLSNNITLDSYDIADKITASLKRTIILTSEIQSGISNVTSYVNDNVLITDVITLDSDIRRISYVDNSIVHKQIDQSAISTGLFSHGFIIDSHLKSDTINIDAVGSRWSNISGFIQSNATIVTAIPVNNILTSDITYAEGNASRGSIAKYADINSGISTSTGNSYAISTLIADIISDYAGFIDKEIGYGIRSSNLTGPIIAEQSDMFALPEESDTDTDIAILYGFGSRGSNVIEGVVIKDTAMVGFAERTSSVIGDIQNANATTMCYPVYNKMYANNYITKYEQVNYRGIIQDTPEYPWDIVDNGYYQYNSFKGLPEFTTSQISFYVNADDKIYLEFDASTPLFDLEYFVILVNDEKVFYSNTLRTNEKYIQFELDISSIVQSEEDHEFSVEEDPELDIEESDFTAFSVQQSAPLTSNTETTADDSTPEPTEEPIDQQTGVKITLQYQRFRDSLDDTVSVRNISIVKSLFASSMTTGLLYKIEYVYDSIGIPSNATTNGFGFRTSILTGDMFADNGSLISLPNANEMVAYSSLTDGLGYTKHYIDGIYGPIQITLEHAIQNTPASPWVISLYNNEYVGTSSNNITNTSEILFNVEQYAIDDLILSLYWDIQEKTPGVNDFSITIDGETAYTSAGLDITYDYINVLVPKDSKNVLLRHYRDDETNNSITSIRKFSISNIKQYSATLTGEFPITFIGRKFITGNILSNNTFIDSVPSDIELYANNSNLPSVLYRQINGISSHLKTGNYVTIYDPLTKHDIIQDTLNHPWEIIGGNNGYLTFNSGSNLPEFAISQISFYINPYTTVYFEWDVTTPEFDLEYFSILVDDEPVFHSNSLRAETGYSQYTLNVEQGAKISLRYQRFRNTRVDRAFVKSISIARTEYVSAYVTGLLYNIEYLYDGISSVGAATIDGLLIDKRNVLGDVTATKGYLYSEPDENNLRSLDSYFDGLAYYIHYANGINRPYEITLLDAIQNTPNTPWSIVNYNNEYVATSHTGNSNYSELLFIIPDTVDEELHLVLKWDIQEKIPGINDFYIIFDDNIVYNTANLDVDYDDIKLIVPPTISNVLLVHYRDNENNNSVTSIREFSISYTYQYSASLGGNLYIKRYIDKLTDGFYAEPAIVVSIPFPSEMEDYGVSFATTTGLVYFIQSLYGIKQVDNAEIISHGHKVSYIDSNLYSYPAECVSYISDSNLYSYYTSINGVVFEVHEIVYGIVVDGFYNRLNTDIFKGGILDGDIIISDSAIVYGEADQKTTLYGNITATSSTAFGDGILHLNITAAIQANNSTILAAPYESNINVVEYASINAHVDVKRMVVDGVEAFSLHSSARAVRYYNIIQDTPSYPWNLYLPSTPDYWWTLHRENTIDAMSYDELPINSYSQVSFYVPSNTLLSLEWKVDTPLLNFDYFSIMVDDQVVFTSNSYVAPKEYSKFEYYVESDDNTKISLRYQRYENSKNDVVFVKNIIMTYTHEYGAIIDSRLMHGFNVFDDLQQGDIELITDIHVKHMVVSDLIAGPTSILSIPEYNTVKSECVQLGSTTHHKYQLSGIKLPFVKTLYDTIEVAGTVPWEFEGEGFNRIAISHSNEDSIFSLSSEMVILTRNANKYYNFYFDWDIQNGQDNDDYIAIFVDNRLVFNSLDKDENAGYTQFDYYNVYNQYYSKVTIGHYRNSILNKSRASIRDFKLSIDYFHSAVINSLFSHGINLYVSAEASPAAFEHTIDIIRYITADIQIDASVLSADPTENKLESYNIILKGNARRIVTSTFAELNACGNHYIHDYIIYDMSMLSFSYLDVEPRIEGNENILQDVEGSLSVSKTTNNEAIWDSTPIQIVIPKKSAITLDYSISQTEELDNPVFKNRYVARSLWVNINNELNYALDQEGGTLTQFNSTEIDKTIKLYIHHHMDESFALDFHGTYHLADIYASNIIIEAHEANTRDKTKTYIAFDTANRPWVEIPNGLWNGNEDDRYTTIRSFPNMPERSFSQISFPAKPNSELYFKYYVNTPSLNLDYFSVYLIYNAQNMYRRWEDVPLQYLKREYIPRPDADTNLFWTDIPSVHLSETWILTSIDDTNTITPNYTTVANSDFDITILDTAPDNNTNQIISSLLKPKFSTHVDNGETSCTLISNITINTDYRFWFNYKFFNIVNATDVNISFVVKMNSDELINETLDESLNAANEYEYFDLLLDSASTTQMNEIMIELHYEVPCLPEEYIDWDTVEFPNLEISNTKVLSKEEDNDTFKFIHVDSSEFDVSLHFNAEVGEVIEYSPRYYARHYPVFVPHYINDINETVLNNKLTFRVKHRSLLTYQVTNVQEHNIGLVTLTVYYNGVEFHKEHIKESYGVSHFNELIFPETISGDENEIVIKLEYNTMDIEDGTPIESVSAPILAINKFKVLNDITNPSIIPRSIDDPANVLDILSVTHDDFVANIVPNTQTGVGNIVQYVPYYGIYDTDPLIYSVKFTTKNKLWMTYRVTNMPPVSFAVAVTATLNGVETHQNIAGSFSSKTTNIEFPDSINNEFNEIVISLNYNIRKVYPNGIPDNPVLPTLEIHDIKILPTLEEIDFTKKRMNFIQLYTNSLMFDEYKWILRQQVILPEKLDVAFRTTWYTVSHGWYINAKWSNWDGQRGRPRWPKHSISYVIPPRSEFRCFYTPHHRLMFYVDDTVTGDRYSIRSTIPAGTDESKRPFAWYNDTEHDIRVHFGVYTWRKVPDRGKRKTRVEAIISIYEPVFYNYNEFVMKEFKWDTDYIPYNPEYSPGLYKVDEDSVTNFLIRYNSHEISNEESTNFDYHAQIHQLSFIDTVYICSDITSYPEPAYLEAATCNINGLLYAGETPSLVSGIITAPVISLDHVIYNGDACDWTSYTTNNTQYMASSVRACDTSMFSIFYPIIMRSPFMEFKWDVMYLHEGDWFDIILSENFGEPGAVIFDTREVANYVERIKFLNENNYMPSHEQIVFIELYGNSAGKVKLRPPINYKNRTLFFTHHRSHFFNNSITSIGDFIIREEYGPYATINVSASVIHYIDEVLEAKPCDIGPQFILNNEILGYGNCIASGSSAFVEVLDYHEVLAPIIIPREATIFPIVVLNNEIEATFHIKPGMEKILSWYIHPDRLIQQTPTCPWYYDDIDNIYYSYDNLFENSVSQAAFIIPTKGRLCFEWKVLSPIFNMEYFIVRVGTQTALAASSLSHPNQEWHTFDYPIRYENTKVVLTYKRYNTSRFNQAFVKNLRIDHEAMVYATFNGLVYHIHEYDFNVVVTDYAETVGTLTKIHFIDTELLAIDTNVTSIVNDSILYGDNAEFSDDPLLTWRNISGINTYWPINEENLYFDTVCRWSMEYTQNGKLVITSAQDTLCQVSVLRHVIVDSLFDNILIFELDSYIGENDHFRIYADSTLIYTVNDLRTRNYTYMIDIGQSSNILFEHYRAVVPSEGRTSIRNPRIRRRHSFASIEANVKITNVWILGDINADDASIHTMSSNNLISQPTSFDGTDIYRSILLHGIYPPFKAGYPVNPSGYTNYNWHYAVTTTYSIKPSDVLFVDDFPVSNIPEKSLPEWHITSTRDRWNMYYDKNGDVRFDLIKYNKSKYAAFFLLLEDNMNFDRAISIYFQYSKRNDGFSVVSNTVKVSPYVNLTDSRTHPFFPRTTLRNEYVFRDSKLVDLPNESNIIDSNNRAYIVFDYYDETDDIGEINPYYSIKNIIIEETLYHKDYMNDYEYIVSNPETRNNVNMAPYYDTNDIISQSFWIKSDYTTMNVKLRFDLKINLNKQGTTVPGTLVNGTYVGSFVFHDYFNIRTAGSNGKIIFDTRAPMHSYYWTNDSVYQTIILEDVITPDVTYIEFNLNTIKDSYTSVEISNIKLWPGTRSDDATARIHADMVLNAYIEIDQNLYARNYKTLTCDIEHTEYDPIYHEIDGKIHASDANLHALVILDLNIQLNGYLLSKPAHIDIGEIIHLVYHVIDADLFAGNAYGIEYHYPISMNNYIMPSSTARQWNVYEQWEASILDFMVYADVDSFGYIGTRVPRLLTIQVLEGYAYKLRVEYEYSLEKSDKRTAMKNGVEYEIYNHLTVSIRNDNNTYPGQTLRSDEDYTYNSGNVKQYETASHEYLVYGESYVDFSYFFNHLPVNGLEATIRNVNIYKTPFYVGAWIDAMLLVRKSIDSEFKAGSAIVKYDVNIGRFIDTELVADRTYTSQFTDKNRLVSQFAVIEADARREINVIGNIYAALSDCNQPEKHVVLYDDITFPANTQLHWSHSRIHNQLVLSSGTREFVNGQYHDRSFSFNDSITSPQVVDSMRRTRRIELSFDYALQRTSTTRSTAIDVNIKKAHSAYDRKITFNSNSEYTYDRHESGSFDDEKTGELILGRTIEHYYENYAPWVGDAILYYDMKLARDILEVYIDDVLIASTNGYVSNKGQLLFFYPGTGIVKVKLIEGTPDTVQWNDIWEYSDWEYRIERFVNYSTRFDTNTPVTFTFSNSDFWTTPKVKNLMIETVDCYKPEFVKFTLIVKKITDVVLLSESAELDGLVYMTHYGSGSLISSSASLYSEPMANELMATNAIVDATVSLTTRIWAKIIAGEAILKGYNYVRKILYRARIGASDVNGLNVATTKGLLYRIIEGNSTLTASPGTITSHVKSSDLYAGNTNLNGKLVHLALLYDMSNADYAKLYGYAVHTIVIDMFIKSGYATTYNTIANINMSAGNATINSTLSRYNYGHGDLIVGDGLTGTYPIPVTDIDQLTPIVPWVVVDAFGEKCITAGRGVPPKYDTRVMFTFPRHSILSLEWDVITPYVDPDMFRIYVDGELMLEESSVTDPLGFRKFRYLNDTQYEKTVILSYTKGSQTRVNRAVVKNITYTYTTPTKMNGNGDVTQ